MNKSVILEKDNNSNYCLIDILGNRTQISFSDIKDTLNLNISFKVEIDKKIDKTNVENIFSNIYDKLLTIDCNNNKYDILLDNIIKDCQFIELLSYQYFLNESLSEKTASHLRSMEELIEIKKQGGIKSQDFGKSLEQFAYDSSKNTLNAILYYTHMQELFEFVRDELYHAEHRLKEISSNMMKLLINNKSSLVIGEDFKRYDKTGDIISYDIEDTVKSIVSALDGISKILVLSSKLKDRPNKIKVPNVVHTSIDSYKGIKNINNPNISILKQKYKEMKLITLMRNDLTHSKSFQSLRQIIFFGRKTPCLLNYDLAYVDVLMWDHIEKGHFERSYEFNDFYTENNNMIKFLHENYHKLYEILQITLDTVKYDITNLCKNSNLDISNSAISFMYHTETKEIINHIDNFKFGKI